MAKFRNGNLLLTSAQSIQQDNLTVLDRDSNATFTSLKLTSSLTEISLLSTDTSLSSVSDYALPTERAVKIYVDSKISGSVESGVDNALAKYDSTASIQATGISVDDSNNITGINSLTIPYGPTIYEFSIDGSFLSDSDEKLPTEKAIKTYVNSKISGSILPGNDNLLAKYDSTASIQATGISVDDSDNITGINSLNLNSGLLVGSDISGADSITLNLGTTINEFSTDETFAGESDTAVPTEKAIKTYINDHMIKILTYLHTQNISSDTWVVNHNLGYKYVTVEVVDSDDKAIIPKEISFDSSSELTITFLSGESGHAVVTAGGMTGYTTPADLSGYIHTQDSSSTIWIVEHSLGTRYVSVQVCDENNSVIIPNSIVYSSTEFLTITFLRETTGYAIVTTGTGASIFQPWVYVTSNYSPTNQQRLAVSTTSGEVTLMLPVSPTFGYEMKIMDASLNFETYNCIIDGNGNNIEGLSDDYRLDVNGTSVWVTYIEPSVGWRVTR